MVKARGTKAPERVETLDEAFDRIGKSARKAEWTQQSEAVPSKKPGISFQHTVLCQTFLPHLPTTARTWEREQGNVSLKIEAGEVKRGRRWVEVLMPHGEKSRLLLIHLNTEAVRTGNPVIDVERSLTALARKLGMDTNGPSLRGFHDQVTRVAAANVRFAVGSEPGSVQGQIKIVKAFDLWWSDDGQPRVDWSSVLRLSDDYMAGLKGYAVPLDPDALAALQHSSLCLDVYCWLAQRLHRIPPGRPQRISWKALKEQFGPDYARERAFRSKFIEVLQKVWDAYPDARMDWNIDDGLILSRSPSPVSKRLVKGGFGA